MELTEAKILSLDSTSVKVHSDVYGGYQKKRKQAIGKSWRDWSAKIHAIPAGDAALVKFSLSTGNASDAKERRPLLKNVRERESAMLLMGKAYEGNETVAKETPALLLSRRRSTAAKNCGIMTANCTRNATALSDFSAACAPVTINSILCSAHSFIWLISI